MLDGRRCGPGDLRAAWVHTAFAVIAGLAVRAGGAHASEPAPAELALPASSNGPVVAGGAQVARVPAVESPSSVPPQGAPVPPTAAEVNPLRRAQGGAASARASREGRGGAPSESRFWLYGDNYFAWQPNSAGRTRIKFQISVRYDLASTQRERHDISFSFAYTQKSYWDLFAFSRSSPFVENDYKPEVFFSYRPNQRERATEASLGIQHESNGLGDDTLVNQTASSRGWNNIFVDGRYGFDRRTPLDGLDMFVSLGLRMWLPFAVEPDRMRDALGYGAATVDLDFFLPSFPRAGRLATRLVVREKNLEGSLYYPLGLLSGGYLRPSLFGQIFYGDAERLITFDQRVTHVYLGIGFL